MLCAESCERGVRGIFCEGQSTCLIGLIRVCKGGSQQTFCALSGLLFAQERLEKGHGCSQRRFPVKENGRDVW
jgi:hypothetical protein